MTVSTPEPKKKPRKPLGCRITRQVSQETLASSVNATATGKLVCHQDQTTGLGSSPMRCVSEIDKLTAEAASLSSSPVACATDSSIYPFHDRVTLEHHKFALRVEAELHPLRLILMRLMSHATLNKKGVFNAPVDPDALGLPDYFQIIQHPMDLGTVKVRLHSVSYKNRQEAVDDIRLCFSNAICYNPPSNPVHVAAKALSEFFEEQLISFLPDWNADSTVDESVSTHPTINHTITRSVSSDPTFPPPPPLTSTASTDVTFDVRGPLSGTRSNSLANHNLPPLFAAASPALDHKHHRCRRGSKRNPMHSCQFCHGHKCDLCQQGCLPLESTLLICNGPHCAGAKIRKGGVYYTAADGTRQYCERCYSGMPSVLPGHKVHGHGGDEECRYKRDLLKRKNDEEVVETWLSCVGCDSHVHRVCAMQHHATHLSEEGEVPQNYNCPSCTTQHSSPPRSAASSPTPSPASSSLWTFVAGSTDPVPLHEIRPNSNALAAEALHETSLSRFMQSKVRELVEGTSSCPNADKTLLVRVISDCDRSFNVPEVVRMHFRMIHTSSQNQGLLPKAVQYRSKAIMLFQKVDGMDVCIFCMYVHEYDEKKDESPAAISQEKRVYVAYLDSVEHFQPRVCRTPVYQEMLISYLATARKRGFQTAHIWACPPMRGNSFVFWSHPASQRTPNQERLVAWYNETLSHAVERSVVVDVKSLYETSFEPLLQDDESPEHKTYKHNGPMICPPLLDGDYWIEEAVRLHAVHISRHHKNKTSDGRIVVWDFQEAAGSRETPSLVVEVARLLRERVIGHPDSAVFRRPVNAAAMGLKDYHTIITKPMDLGTIYAQLIFGEYADLAQLAADFELMIANAQLYNPKGHFVHIKAEELSQRFFAELAALAETSKNERLADRSKWGSLCLSLDACQEAPAEHKPVLEPQASQASIPSLAPENDAAASCSAEESTNTTQARNNSKISTPEDVVMSTPPPLSNGPEAVHQSMVGSDARLFVKVHAAGKSPVSAKKLANGKRRHSLLGFEKEHPPPKRRRQAWLGEQVGASVRRMRPYFYACSLSSSEPSPAFETYSASFSPDEVSKDTPISSRVADGRHSFLEFSQLHHLEFDTLRRSKYSTAILLYHLHNDKAPGVVPMCSGCRAQITDVRWHKTGKVIESPPPHVLSSTTATSSLVQKRASPSLRKKKPEFVPEELCRECYERRTDKDDFMPIQVTLQ